MRFSYLCSNKKTSTFCNYSLDSQSSDKIEWSLPLDQHLDLTQYVATAGKRKKRDAEAVAEAFAEAIPELKSDDLMLPAEARFWNVSTASYSYDPTQYFRYALAGALLLGLAAQVPAPNEDVLPVDLPASRNDHIERIEQSIKQNYQERFNFPNDKVISKRQLLDVLLPFRRKPGQGKRPPGRPKRKPGRILPK